MDVYLRETVGIGERFLDLNVESAFDGIELLDIYVRDTRYPMSPCIRI